MILFLERVAASGDHRSSLLCSFRPCAGPEASGGDGDGRRRSLPGAGGPAGDPDGGGPPQGHDREGVSSAQSHQLPAGEEGRKTLRWWWWGRVFSRITLSPLTGRSRAIGSPAASQLVPGGRGGDTAADGGAAGPRRPHLHPRSAVLPPPGRRSRLPAGGRSSAEEEQGVAAAVRRSNTTSSNRFTWITILSIFSWTRLEQQLLVWFLSK